MSKSKKTQQLGMNPSTASGRLVKDLLFDFVERSGIRCHRCDKELTRDTFSIEHKEAWLDSANPVDTYFNIENITYSHLSCNIKSSRNGVLRIYTDKEARERKNERAREAYCPKKRAKRYKKEQSNVPK